MKPDILFIHPNSSSAVYQKLAYAYSAIEPPIWAALLTQHCLKAGFRAEILDAEAYDLKLSDVAFFVKDVKPKYTCFVVYGQQPSASTQNMHGAVEEAVSVHHVYPETQIIFVGGHVSALPLETMQKHKEIDMCCTNEGVNTIIDILKGTPIHNIDGLAYRDDRGKTVITKPAVLADMKYFQGMPWDKLPMEKYRTALWHAFPNRAVRKPFASLYTSLGCPFACSFCMINSPFGGSSFRYWEPSVIIREFEELAKREITNIKIADEMFVLNPNHFMKVCELIIERGYKFNIWCYARVDTVKEQYLETLKKAGVNYLALGIESANNAVKHDVAKTNKVDPRLVVSQIQNAGIHVAANYIFGLPKDTLETMQETLNLAMGLNTEMANFYSCMAYPGSALYKKAKDMGWELPSSYIGYSQHSYECQPLPTEFISASQVLEFRDMAWRTYHTNPSYLEMIESKFGQYEREQIEKTTKIELKRRLLDGGIKRVDEGCGEGSRICSTDRGAN